MNLPNKITLFRVCLIPVFLYVYLHPTLDGWTGHVLAAAIFGLASFTDFVDGYLARRWKLVTNFGKLMDPLADKLLVSAALIAMVATNVLPAWVAVVLISREFFVSGVRQLALEQNIVMAASFWAKVKTAVQMVTVIYLMLPVPSQYGRAQGNFFVDTLSFVTQGGAVVSWLLIIASVFFSALSAVEYAVKNKQVFK